MYYTHNNRDIICGYKEIVDANFVGVQRQRWVIIDDYGEYDYTILRLNMSIQY